MTPLSMEFSRQEYWSGLPFPLPGDLPDPGIKPSSPELQADTLPSEPPGEPGGLGCHFLFLFCCLNFAFLYINIKYTQTPQRMTWSVGCTHIHTHTHTHTHTDSMASSQTYWIRRSRYRHWAHFMSRECWKALHKGQQLFSMLPLICWLFKGYYILFY